MTGRTRILWASSWLKLDPTKISFLQAKLSCSIKSETVKSKLSLFELVETNGLRSLLSQGRVQTWIDSPLPILRRTPCFITTCEAWILHHIKFELYPRWASKKSTNGKYLTLKTLNTIVTWLVVKFQPYFLSMTRLKACKCLNPIPPILFHSHFIPIEPIDSSLLLIIIIPPKRVHFMQIIFESGWKQENTHAIREYWLNN